MVARGKVEGRGIPPATNLHRVLLRPAVGHVDVGRIRDSVEQLLAAGFCRRQLLLEGAELLFDALELGELFRRRPALDLARRAQLLDPRLDLTDRVVGVEQLVEEVGRALARECGTHRVGLGSGGAQIDHARESR